MTPPADATDTERWWSRRGHAGPAIITGWQATASARHWSGQILRGNGGVG
ncbi:hypothetical protein SAMN02787118_1265 [Streptomyces mirabilis]|jgi:hypothetical protein|uniref:Uncharacterized protein n=1 Tax=Streptomyces mirabilis TaxID=68239 RepID=A0A1I2TU07_9ACTN|nr:hypothetical protein SAMN02787118_1265 [Streptomyces mirabilis]